MVRKVDESTQGINTIPLTTSLEGVPSNLLDKDGRLTVPPGKIQKSYRHITDINVLAPHYFNLYPIPIINVEVYEDTCNIITNEYQAYLGTLFQDDKGKLLKTTVYRKPVCDVNKFGDGYTEKVDDFNAEVVNRWKLECLVNVEVDVCVYVNRLIKTNGDNGYKTVTQGTWKRTNNPYLLPRQFNSVFWWYLDVNYPEGSTQEPINDVFIDRGREIYPWTSQTFRSVVPGYSLEFYAARECLIIVGRAKEVLKYLDEQVTTYTNSLGTHTRGYNIVTVYREDLQPGCEPTITRNNPDKNPPPPEVKKPKKCECDMSCCPQNDSDRDILARLIKIQKYLETPISGEITYTKKDKDKGTSEIIKRVIQGGIGLAGLGAAEMAIINFLIELLLGEFDEIEDKEPLVPGIPDAWEIRLQGDTPQLAIMYANKVDNYLGRDRRSLHIPHYKHGKGHNVTFPKYKKGSYYACLTLSDNSKIVCNAVNTGEASRVVYDLLNHVKDEYRKNVIYTDGKRKGAVLKEFNVEPITAAYYSKGKKQAVPDWINDLRP